MVQSKGWPRETKRPGKQWVIGKQGETDGAQRQGRLRRTRKRGRQRSTNETWRECGDRWT